MRLLPVILIGCLFGLFLFMAVLFTLYRLRYIRERRRRHQASIPGDEQPVSKFVVRKGRVVDISQMSRPPSMISHHSSARNRMSVYSKLSHGIRNNDNSPCGCPRYWPVSMYSAHSQRHMPWPQRRSALSGHRHPLPPPSVEAQNKRQWNESKETLPRVEEGSPHPIDDAIARSRPIKTWDSSSTKVNSTPSAKSSQGVFDRTATPSVEVEIVLGKPAITNPTPKSTIPRSLGESSNLVAATTGQIAPDNQPTHPTLGIDDVLSRQFVGVPTTQDRTNTFGFATCRYDDGSARSSKSPKEVSSSDCFSSVPLSSTTRPQSSPDPHRTKHRWPRESISSMRTFDSDISDVCTVGHATSIMLPADPRMSPLARPPTLNRPLSKYRVPIENRYAKALPLLPPTYPILKRSEFGSTRSCPSSRHQNIDLVELERESGSRPPIVSCKKCAPGPEEARDPGGGGGIGGVEGRLDNL